MSVFLYARARCLHIVLILVQVRFRTFWKSYCESLSYISYAVVVALDIYNIKAFALHMSGVS